MFLTTQWSLVRAAGRQGAIGSDTTARAALESLCQSYWTPLYRYARRSGHRAEDAEDLVQGLFANLLSGNSFLNVKEENGKFRAYLLAAMKKHMASDWQRSHRQKRGGFVSHLSLDWVGVENSLQLELEDHLSPDVIFDRDWAQAILEHVLSQVAEDFEEEGRSGEFEKMKNYLTLSSARIPYAELAEELGLTEGAARIAVHRLRKKYRQRLRAEIAGTLSSGSQVEEEMASLFDALRR